MAAVLSEQIFFKTERSWFVYHDIKVIDKRFHLTYNLSIATFWLYVSYNCNMCALSCEYGNENQRQKTTILSVRKKYSAKSLIRNKPCWLRKSWTKSQQFINNYWRQLSFISFVSILKETLQYEAFWVSIYSIHSKFLAKLNTGHHVIIWQTELLSLFQKNNWFGNTALKSWLSSFT